MLDYINEREPLHILTVEDPIEFTFTDKKAYINQREIGLDCMDWHKALKDAVRQDPDVILVGELRDVETFEAAVHAAETGHLVFGTIHASSAGTTINRILDLFPPEKHDAIRQALANNLKAVVAQKLRQGHQEGPRVPTNEIMIVNPTDPQADHRGRGQQAPRRHPHRLPGRHGRFHREPAPAGRARRHRQGDRPGSVARTPSSSRWPSRASRWRRRVFCKNDPLMIAALRSGLTCVGGVGRGLPCGPCCTSLLCGRAGSRPSRAAPGFYFDPVKLVAVVLVYLCLGRDLLVGRSRCRRS